MHWRHVSITTTPCWGSRLVALRAHVLLAERIGAHPLSQCAHPGQLGGEACRGLPSECMLGDGASGVPCLTPNTTGAPFCDVHMHMVYWLHVSIGLYALIFMAVTHWQSHLWCMLQVNGFKARFVVFCSCDCHGYYVKDLSTIFSRERSTFYSMRRSRVE